MKKEGEVEKKGKNTGLKYFSVATNTMYTLTTPILLMMFFYMWLKKHFLHEENPIILVICIFLGVGTGYWSLAKQLKKIEKSEKRKGKNVK